MGTQSVTYLGTPYSFPADAKDSEILEFLDKQPKANSPIPPPTMNMNPAAKGMHESYLFGDPDKDPSQTLVGKISNRVGQQGETLEHAANLLVKDPVGSFTPKSNKMFGPKETLKKAYNATIGPLVNDVTSIRSHPENILSDALIAGTMHAAGSGPGAGSATGEGAMAAGVESGIRAPIPESTLPRSSSSVAESTPLVKKIPGTRSVVRDVAGLVHGAARPTSISGIMDAYTSIKSILAKHNAGTPEPAEVNPNNPFGMMEGAGTHGTPVSEWGKRIPPAEPPAPRTPAWKMKERLGATPEGTPVESVAPHTQGTLSQSDISAMLQKTGPPRGGKGQTGRAILRKNIKSMETK